MATPAIGTEPAESQSTALPIAAWERVGALAPSSVVVSFTGNDRGEEGKDQRSQSDKESM